MKRALLALALGAALASASPAFAQHGGHAGHDTSSASTSSADMLTSSSPANGATLAEAPRALTLSFVHPVMLQTVAVTGPDDAPVRASFRRSNAPTSSWSVALPQLSPGDYSARWAANGGGHQMEGVIEFTVQ